MRTFILITVLKHSFTNIILLNIELNNSNNAKLSDYII